jgi:hypothetical protein
MTRSNTTRTEKSAPLRRRVIAVGKRVDGRWQVRTSLWRYLATTALSAQ